MEALTEINAANTATLSAKVKKKLARLLAALPQQPPRATPPQFQAAAMMMMLLLVTMIDDDEEGDSTLRAWLKIGDHNAEFLDLICNTMAIEQSLPVKAMLAECLCDYIKLTHWSMFASLVRHSQYVQKSI